MENNKIWYLGYFISFISLVSVFAFKNNEQVYSILMFIFTISMTITTVMVMHNKKMEKDSSYRINVNDERNQKIKNKVNATMTPILLIIMGIVTAICLSLKDYLPAGLLLIGIISYPIISFFINGVYEKRY